MKAAIVSRIFQPEASAASFRLGALATAIVESGVELTVLTVNVPRELKDSLNPCGYRVRRAPVLRDRTGYVRGYVQYLSFDIPLFFRLLFGQKYDFVVVEPPPTSGFVVKVVCKLRRIPYFYYAADIWSDASSSTANSVVASVLRRVEKSVFGSAKSVLSVNDGVSKRILEIQESAEVITVGNGVDSEIFNASVSQSRSGKYFLYSGTVSEWQGAAVFIEAFGQVCTEYDDLRLIFVGQGSDWEHSKQVAKKFPNAQIEFIPTVPPNEAASLIRGAIATLASIKPESQYDFAFPTKVFASWMTGTPVLYSGSGKAVPVIRSNPELGIAVEHDVYEVNSAMRYMLSNKFESDREWVSAWAKNKYSLQDLALKAVSRILKRLKN